MIHTKIKMIFKIFLFVSLLMTGSAFPLPVDLTIPNEEGMPTMNYAQVNGSADGNIYHFYVDLAPGLKSTLNGGKNFGLDKFYFNTDLLLTDSMFTNINPTSWNINYIKNVAGFGRFDLELKDPGKRTDHLSFDIDYGTPVYDSNFIIPSTGNAVQGNKYFAAHIGGFDFEDFGSTYVTNGESTHKVPEPSTMLMISGGLFWLVACRNKFQKK